MPKSLTVSASLTADNNNQLVAIICLQSGKKNVDFWLVLTFIMACSFSLFSFCSNPWVVSSEAIQ